MSLDLVEIVPLDSTVTFSSPLLIGASVDVELPELVVGVTIPGLEVEVDIPAFDFEVEPPDPVHLVIPQIGPAGSSTDTIELYDSVTPPTTYPPTYLRFVRDVDGDVQQIILRTVD